MPEHVNRHDNQWECTTRVTAPTKYRSSPHNRPTDSQPTATILADCPSRLLNANFENCPCAESSRRMKLGDRENALSPTPAYCRPDISIPFAEQEHTQFCWTKTALQPFEFYSLRCCPTTTNPRLGIEDTFLPTWTLLSTTIITKANIPECISWLNENVELLQKTPHHRSVDDDFAQTRSTESGQTAEHAYQCT